MLYQLYCSQCHGVRGNGKGINAPSLFVAPRDHTSSEEMGMLTDDRIFAAVKYGGTAVGKSALMPSWNGTIADDDIRLLVGYVRELSGAAP
jgi:cytochrome c oxidase cbb3-type subunit 3